MLKAKAVKVGNVSTFQMQWPELRDVVRSAAIDRKTPEIKLPGNRAKALDYADPGRSSFAGYTTEDLKRWVTRGYRADNLGLSVVPPVREKRRYVFGEDLDEIHVDRVLSGEDNYTGEFTKRIVIPGMKIRVNTGFSATTDASVVNAYNVFVCQCVQSLDSSGVDTEITFVEDCVNMIPRSEIRCITEIRVKRMNEASDFASYSAFLSPASFRTFYFTAFVLHSDSLGKEVSPGLGRAANPGSWDVKMEDDGTLNFYAPYMPSGIFPKGDMEMKFRSALRLT